MKIKKMKPMSRSGIALLAGAAVLPSSVQAQSSLAAIMPVEMNLMSYLIIGALLVLSIMMFFLFQRRYKTAASQLKDITSELGTTRKRLNESNQELEQSKQELKATSTRYQNILFDANVGMFQMDLNGKCSYINTALQEISGLYPKKAIKEGLTSSIHPDDQESFKAAWSAFVESNATFNESFRFRLAKGKEVHVICRANKVLNERKEVESYIGWITDVSRFNEEVQVQQAATERYEHFVGEVVEGFYKLTPETPISLVSPEKDAATIMEKFTLSDCNETFSTIYGSTPKQLLGKSISELKDGVGPFRNTESIESFITAGMKLVDLESVRQDQSGSRLNLTHNVVGIVEDNKLTGIWGIQRNITLHKREKAELQNQIQFMHRILNALPADVQVKDTRCRYLYASKKLADRTGIPQEDWIGKTIYEVMPGTPRDHDQRGIDTMKSGKLTRFERSYDARGKTGWMETIQIPLVSDEGLVEGLVGISIDTSERKAKEDATRHQKQELEQQLQHTRGELAESRADYGKTATSLSDTIQKLKIAEVEKTNREHEFKEHLGERKRAEEVLRRSEQALLARQQQLEEQLSARLQQLDAETDKRTKWEELLSIKEDELRKAEEQYKALAEHYDQETTVREQAEARLEASQTALEKTRRELSSLTETRESELEKLNRKHEDDFSAEHSARTKAENKLNRTSELLVNTQEKVKRLTEQHTEELEKEVAERKAAAEKLMHSMEELDELRQQFGTRLEEETKSIKQELAKKQIREKALRQHEKDLEKRIKELENLLQRKAQEFAEQIQAREGAEVQKQQIEQKMEQLTKRQQELVARETQKLNLNIAEIRLDEVKLRKRAGDLAQANEELEDTLRSRDAELEKTRREIKKIEAVLSENQASLQQLSNDQSKVIAKETAKLEQQLTEMQKVAEELRGQIGDLQHEKTEVEQNLDTRNNDLTKAAREYRKVVDAYKASQAKLKEIADGQEAFVAKKTDSLKKELHTLKQSAEQLAAKEGDLQQRVSSQQQEINKLHETLKDEIGKREDSQKALQDLQVAFDASQENADAFVLEQTNELKRKLGEHQANVEELKQQLDTAGQTIQERDTALSSLQQEREETLARMKKIEAKLAGINETHQQEIKQSMAEFHEVTRVNCQLIDELNDSVRTTLNPVIKTAVIMEQAGNLTDDQKLELTTANNRCRSLVDMMNYRTELTHLADGSDEVSAEQTDLHALISDIDQQFTHRAETKKLFFAVSFAQYQAANNIPKHVTTDENKLRKVLSILLGYALDKTGKGRMGLHATRNASDSENMNITFELAYTPAETRDELLSGIFDTANGETVDLKYGLTLARRYISLLGGEVALEYRDAGVTSLAVTFPFKRADSEGVISSEEKEKQAGAA